MEVMQCPECGGTGEHAAELDFGVYVEDEGELVMRPCRICKGEKVVDTWATTCADCNVEILVTIPHNEPLGERVCPDCAGN